MQTLTSGHIFDIKKPTRPLLPAPRSHTSCEMEICFTRDSFKVRYSAKIYSLGHSRMFPVLSTLISRVAPSSCKVIDFYSQGYLRVTSCLSSSTISPADSAMFLKRDGSSAGISIYLVLINVSSFASAFLTLVLLSIIIDKMLVDEAL